MADLALHARRPKVFDPPELHPLVELTLGVCVGVTHALELKHSGEWPGCNGAVSRVEKEIVSEDKPKPVLDEETLDKLLEAAYVLQEHNRELQ